MRRKVQIYTDGSSLGNPGRAAWAALVDGELHTRYIGIATNNYAEFMAIYQSLSYLQPGDHAVIHTDSRLMIGWLSQGWKINNPEILMMKETIDAYLKAQNIEVSFVKIAGHAHHPQNEMVDRAARNTAKWGYTAPYGPHSPSSVSS